MIAIQPTAEQIVRWLEQVPDPEIPVISVIDLGIVRHVGWGDDGACIVTITPTYSGCPATTVIGQAITAALGGHGIDRVRLAIQLSPAWSSDWLSEDGKAKLREYGIAPPAVQTIALASIGSRSRLSIPCPRCASADTSCISQFGSTPCKSLYRCNDCLEPFDYFKCH